MLPGSRVRRREYEPCRGGDPEPAMHAGSSGAAAGPGTRRRSSDGGGRRAVDGPLSPARADRLGRHGHRLPRLRRAPPARCRGQGGGGRRPRPGRCARRRRRRGSTTPASSPSTSSASATGARCSSPSWSPGGPWRSCGREGLLCDRDVAEIGAEPLRGARPRPRARRRPPRHQAPERDRRATATAPGRRAKLMDFGIARIAGAPTPDRGRRGDRHARLHVARAGRAASSPAPSRTSTRWR